MTFIAVIVLMGCVVMVVVVMMSGILAALSRVVEQRHPRNLGQGQLVGMLGQRLGHETFQLGADPHHQIGVIDAANIGRTQGEVVGRGAGWQQDFGLAHAIRDGRRDKTQGFDGGQHLEGADRQTHCQQRSDQSKNSHRGLVRE